MVMDRSIQNAFYNSRAWRRCAKAYAASKQNLCERCLDKDIIKPYKIVHHKIYLTEETLSDPDVSMNWMNLECLCMDCHNYEHKNIYSPLRDDVAFDSKGNLIQRGGPPGND